MMITVIIPSHKPKTYILECLDSLKNQTLSKELFEIIIVLNGCREPYLYELSEYSTANSTLSINLLHTDEAGVSNARNIGILHARGEYLVFIDDDDIVSPTFLEKLLSVSSPSCVGCSDSWAFVSSINQCVPNFVTGAYRKCLGRPFTLLRYRKFLSPPWGKMIHKEMIGSTLYPVHLGKSEDSVFFLKVSPDIGDMKLAESDAIYYQRLREGSVMRTRTKVSALFREHIKVELEYAKILLSGPFQYNWLLVFSRMTACVKNFIDYAVR